MFTEAVNLLPPGMVSKPSRKIPEAGGEPSDPEESLRPVVFRSHPPPPTRPAPEPHEPGHAQDPLLHHSGGIHPSASKPNRGQPMQNPPGDQTERIQPLATTCVRLQHGLRERASQARSAGQESRPECLRPLQRRILPRAERELYLQPRRNARVSGVRQLSSQQDHRPRDEGGYPSPAALPRFHQVAPEAGRLSGSGPPTRSQSREFQPILPNPR